MAVFTRQPISVGKLLLDVRNYRIVKQDSQKAARDAIIGEQGKKLVELARDITVEGLSPFDLMMVVDAEDGNGNYVVVEGNRRLTALNLLLDPELARDTSIHGAFVKMNKKSADAIPKVVDCTIAPNRAAALTWIDRKHSSGLGGAGTEPWTAMAKARADAEQGTFSPALDVVNFVLTGGKLDSTLCHHLQGSQFKLTTLERLVTTKELQDQMALRLENGRLVSDNNQEWARDVFTDLLTAIYKGERDGQKFTERDIDSKEKRKAFAKELVSGHSGKKKASKRWTISGDPAAVAESPGKPTQTPKSTPSTDDQVNLIPKKFKLELPPGKINDCFVELKKLDVAVYRHAVSVLFRVFIEFTLDHYIKASGIELPKDKSGHVIDKLSVRLARTLKHVRDAGLMTGKELKPIDVAVSDSHSLLAPDTLNAYVHGEWMNPDPTRLKVAWHDVQTFVERLWAPTT